MPEPGTPQDLNRFSYARNNPLYYRDPSGHWVHIVVGALVGAGISYGVQVVANVCENGLSVQAFTDVDAVKIVAGGVAGAVGAATFGVGAAVLGTGWGAILATGAASGVASGQAARVVTNAATRRPLTEGLLNPRDMAVDAVAGAAGAGIAKGLGKLRPGRTASSAEPEHLRAGKAAHRQAKAYHQANTPEEQLAYVDLEMRFRDPASGKLFSPDYVNHWTGEIIENKPWHWQFNPRNVRLALRQAARYADLLNSIYGDLRLLDGAPPYDVGSIYYYQ